MRKNILKATGSLDIEAEAGRVTIIQSRDSVLTDCIEIPVCAVDLLIEALRVAKAEAIAMADD